MKPILFAAIEKEAASLRGLRALSKLEAGLSNPTTRQLADHEVPINPHVPKEYFGGHYFSQDSIMQSSLLKDMEESAFGLKTPYRREYGLQKFRGNEQPKFIANTLRRMHNYLPLMEPKQASLDEMIASLGEKLNLK